MSDRLRAAYDDIKTRARARAGRPGDITQRVMEHHAIYQDSRGNHAFPLVALHGALWGYNFFETTGKLGEIISYRYFLDAEEKAVRLGMLNGFAEGFKAVNREVFVDTYTNWYFTREHGREPGADALVNGALLEALNEAHAARAAGRELDDARKRHVFEQALHFEQEITVAPGIARELAKFDCPILRALCMKPLVRFAYFPFWRTFAFSDFSNKDERIERALESFDLAAAEGWEAVLASMRDYGVLPDTFFEPATTG
ncbi:MAG TPA: hypothetical protein PLR99_15780 [Polyangiaceae bacterium]|jgi:hypothetical protein|nr:hypothetical protein [Polyangiaceae bacterium]